MGNHIEPHFHEVLLRVTTRNFNNPEPMRIPFRADDIMRMIRSMVLTFRGSVHQMRRQIQNANFNFDARGPVAARAENERQLSQMIAIFAFWQRLYRDPYSRLQWIRYLRNLRVPWNPNQRMYPLWFS